MFAHCVFNCLPHLVRVTETSQCQHTEVRLGSNQSSSESSYTPHRLPITSLKDRQTRGQTDRHVEAGVAVVDVDMDELSAGQVGRPQNKPTTTVKTTHYFFRGRFMSAIFYFKNKFCLYSHNVQI